MVAVDLVDNRKRSDKHRPNGNSVAEKAKTKNNSATKVKKKIIKTEIDSTDETSARGKSIPKIININKQCYSNNVGEKSSSKIDAKVFYTSKKNDYIKLKPSSVRMKVRERQEENEINLVIVWVMIGAELGFDLITGVIAFFSTAGATTCCDHDVNLGPLAMTASIPLFFLIATELTFLIQAILVSAWQKERKSRSLKDALCSCVSKWNSRTLVGYLNWMTIINPFFGCLIAYILLYQSDKTQSFAVLGIEFLSIAIHIIAVKMVGGLQTCGSKAVHSIVLLPFFITVIFVSLFLREGGMCYVVETRGFGFSGCDVCPSTLKPPDSDGNCVTQISPDGIEGVFGERIGSILEGGMEQGDYCSASVNFCFFEF
mmetsp:Transcript_12030/g.28527  ORF Transcript_12030/g.28527 Transcript_12030/m.28527 type:complete len:372 (+) Transcript_12030:110-1225(+)